MNPQVANPNDLKVVVFHNTTDFGFTPEMGCMYDGRPIFGITGAPGVNAGEKLTVPYHVGQVLARNLAKRALNMMAPAVDPAGIPTGVPLWDTEKLEKLKASFITELYVEDRPAVMSEADKALAKIEEYKKIADETKSKLDQLLAEKEPAKTGTGYQDKAEVIAELTKRGIKFDARSSKATLEKLIV